MKPEKKKEIAGTVIIDYYNYEVFIKTLLKNGYTVEMKLIDEGKNLQISYSK